MKQVLPQKSKNKVTIRKLKSMKLKIPLSATNLKCEFDQTLPFFGSFSSFEKDENTCFDFPIKLFLSKYQPCLTVTSRGPGEDHDQ